MALGDLRHYIRTYDADLDAQQCERLMAAFESLRRYQQPNGRAIRAGLEESAWTELNLTRVGDPALLDPLRARIGPALQRYNEDLGLTIPVPPAPSTSDYVYKRYRAGAEERFQLHFDAAYHVANRYLVVLWYLNDVEVGGETTFPQLGIAVKPRRGRLLLFPPYWMYQHEGATPVSGDKHIVSFYLLFGDPRPA
ncbi:MAG: 2OG-Fe(II) oxygenase [Steroidobacteraceae bacterium]